MKKTNLLVIDIGNTDTSVAVFDNKGIASHFRFRTVDRTADELELHLTELLAERGKSLDKIQAAAIATVVPSAGKLLVEALNRHIVRVVDVGSPEIRKLVPVKYKPASAVGADRIANAIAAHSLINKNSPKIVVDFGTATTFDCIAADGTYLGGVIHPGVEISAQSLFSKAAMLPSVEFASVNHALGTSTISSIQSGLYYGIVGAVKEILDALESEIGKSVRIGTGGLAEAVCSSVGGFKTVDTELTLKGIKILYDVFMSKNKKVKK